MCVYFFLYFILLSHSLFFFLSFSRCHFTIHAKSLLSLSSLPPSLLLSLPSSFLIPLFLLPIPSFLPSSLTLFLFSSLSPYIQFFLFIPPPPFPPSSFSSLPPFVSIHPNGPFSLPLLVCFFLSLSSFLPSLPR